MYCVDSIGLWGEATPPPAMSLIWLAPYRKLFAGSQPDFVRAVGNDCDAHDFGVTQRTAGQPRKLKREPGGAVA